MVELHATSGFYGKRIIHFKICYENPAGTKPDETLASLTFHLHLRLDRFIIHFVLNLIITILIGFICRLDRFSNAGTAARLDR